MAASLSIDHLLVFTGKGPRESLNIEQVTEGLSNCVNACGKLSWEGFVTAIRHAETLYAVDSMAGHVAAAVGTKCVSIFGGMSTIARWRPEARTLNCLVKRVAVFALPAPVRLCRPQMYGRIRHA